MIIAVYLHIYILPVQLVLSAVGEKIVSISNILIVAAVMDGGRELMMSTFCLWLVVMDGCG